MSFAPPEDLSCCLSSTGGRFLLEALPDLCACDSHLPYTKLARLAFGEQWLPALNRIIAHLVQVGCVPQKACEISRPMCIVLLLARSPRGTLVTATRHPAQVPGQ